MGSVDGSDDLDECPFVCTDTAYETHKCDVFGASFNQYRGPEETPFLATVGSNVANVYEFQKIMADNRGEMKLLSSFRDDNTDEAYYSVCWSLHPTRRISLLCVGGELGFIRVIDVASGNVHQVLIGHGAAVNEMRAHPKEDGIVASCSADRSVKVWNVSNSQCLINLGGFKGHGNQVLSLDFSLDGSYIVTGSMDHNIKLWSLKGAAHFKIANSLGKDPRSELENDESVTPSSNRTFRETSSMDGTSDSEKENEYPVPDCHWTHLLNRRISMPDAGEYGASSVHPIHIQFPVCNANELHINYVDCIRTVGNFIVSKSAEEFICIWKFGKFDEGMAGIDYGYKIDSFVSIISRLKLSAVENWFVKFDIDPSKKWLACGNKLGQVQVYNIKGSSVCNEYPAQELFISNDELQIRQICFDPYGRVAAVVGDRGLISRLDRCVKGGPVPKSFKLSRRASKTC